MLYALFLLKQLTTKTIIMIPIVLNKLRITSVVLLIIIALNALAAGYSFMVEPSGEDLGITTDLLRYSPFENYRIPGLLLFIANGLLSLATTFIVLSKHKLYPYAIIFQGSVLFGWIIIQLSLLQFMHLLHVICGIIGLILIIMGSVILNEQARDLSGENCLAE